MSKLFVLILSVVVVSACGEDSDAVSEDVADSIIEAGEDAASDVAAGGDPQEAADDLAENLEDVQEAVGGGSATLTVGDMTWTFGSVLCAIGEEETGQEGAEFVLSSIQDGMQMYAAIDSFGHSVSLDDIEDFENPKVSLSSAEGEVILDGKNVSADMEFRDATTDSFETVSGHFEATCP